MSDKTEHLNMIENVITRMAHNSLQIKCWCIAIVSAMIVLTHEAIILIGILPVILFWYLDAHYLALERAFRQLYNVVRSKSDSEIDFSMNIEKVTLSDVLFTWSVIPFYGVLAIALCIAVSINLWVL